MAADNSATVIVANLDDSELRKSIESLVSTVNTSTQQMATSFNTYIQSMTEALRQLSGAQRAATDETKRASEQRTATYDQEAAAMRRATGSKRNENYITLNSDVDKTLTYLVNANKDVDAQLAQILTKEQQLVQEKQREEQHTQAVLAAQQQLTQAVSGTAIGYGTVREQQERSNQAIYASRANIQSQTESYSKLEHTISNILGIRLQEVNLTTNANGTYNALTESLKKMQMAYREMSAEERNSVRGRGLADNIQRVSRAIQQIQTQMNRPISMKNLLGMPEKTLDDIAFKLQAISRMRGQFEPQSAELQKLNAEYQRLSKVQSEALGKSTALAKSNNVLARSYEYIKNRLAFYFTVGALTGFFKQLIDIRGQYEMIERSLGILIDSADRGTQVFKELSDMALVSPYTLIDLSNAAKQLVAYDVAAKDVVETTRRIADMSAAVGVPIERLTYALGQIKAYGYLNARDARMFANAGIPLVKELADYYTELEGRLVSVGDVYDRIKKKAIDYNDVMSVINKLTDEGGRFFDFQAKVADTLRVQLANLTLAWNNMLNDIGESNKGLLNTSIKTLKVLLLHWRDIEKAIYSVAIAYGVVKASQFAYLVNIGKVNSGLALQAVLGKRATTAFAGLGASITKMLTSPWTPVFAAVAILADLAIHSYQTAKAIEEINKAIRDGAKESAESIDKYKQLRTSQDTLSKALGGKLSVEEGEKAWESLREEIEKSSSASDVFISKLLQENDLNTRLVEGFKLAEKIEEANRDLSDLASIQVSKDSALFGLFGEGISEDIQDFVDVLPELKTYAESFGKDFEKVYSENFHVQEAQKEIDNLADEIYRKLSIALGDGIGDKDKVQEGISRIIKQIELNEPTLTGKVADVFEVSLSKALGDRFGEVYDANAVIWQQFNRELKKYRHEFSGITSELIDGTQDFTEAQEDAFRKIAKDMKETLPPEFSSVLDSMLADLNSRDFRIRIVTTLGVQNLDDLQKDYAKRFLGFGNRVLTKQEQDELRSKYGVYNKKDSENTIQWQKRLNDAEKDQLELIEQQEEIQAKIKDTQDKKYQIAEKTKQSAKTELGIIREVSQYEGFDLYTKKNKGGSGAKKDPLGESLTKEIQLITDIQKRYNDYRQMGVDAQTAIQKATEEYGNTLIRTNATLKKYGVKTLSSEELANMPLQQIRDFYREQLRVANELGNTKGVEALEKALANINVEITKIDYKKITDGLNSELSKLKDEYELAVELDANPELSNVFMDMMGISSDELQSLPHTAKEVAERAQEAINSVFKKYNVNKVFDLESNLNRANFEAWVNANGQQLKDGMVTQLKSIVDLVNKTRLDETKKQVQEWGELIKKYGEYEARKTEIRKRAEKERRVALARNAGSNIVDAINLQEARDLAKVEFERFQQSEAWIAATGDLATMSKSAIEILIQRLLEMKDKLKDLDPKQIKAFNNAMNKLRKEQRKNSPFHAIADAVDEAKERFNSYQVEIDETEKAYEKLKEKQRENGGWVSMEDEKQMGDLIDKIRKLRQEQKELGKVNSTTIVSAVNSTISTIKQATGVFNELAEAIGGERMTEASQVITKTMNVIEKAGEGAAAGAQLGGGWGALVGGIVGLLVGAVTQLSDVISGNEAVNDSLKKSEREVKKLEMAYNELEYAIDNACGTGVTGLQHLALENKKLQLAELQHQLELEKSRKEKNKDEDKILEIEENIADLQRQIDEYTNDIVNNLLGVSKVGDAIEDMVGSMIDALRQGESAVDVFNGKIDDMIVNLLKKFLATKYLAPIMQRAWDEMEAVTMNRTQPIEQEISALNERRKWLEEEREKYINDMDRQISMLTMSNSSADQHEVKMLEEQKGSMVKVLDNEIADTEKSIELAKKRLLEAGMLTESDMDTLVEILNSLKAYSEPLADTFEKIIERMGLQGSGKESEMQLSALQQGIQGITEDTAGALEAYMNSVSQQVYLHSSLLTQIKDTILGFDFDVSVGTQAEMLLQLQNSYQTQESIRSMLEGVLSPSGRAFTVELA